MDPFKTRFILDENRNPVECENIQRWSDWFSNFDNRNVKQDEFENGISVSTVFIGINNRYEKGPPLLWETMIFGGKNNGEINRYSSEKEAIEGHKEMIDRIFK